MKRKKHINKRTKRFLGNYIHNVVEAGVIVMLTPVTLPLVLIKAVTGDFDDPLGDERREMMG